MPPDNGAPSVGNRTYDRLAYCFYLLAAILCTLAWWRAQVPFPLLGSDSADIASFAAAWEFPDRFRTDPTLGRIEIFGLYATVHIPLLIGLSKLVGDYGTATMALLIPTLFLQGMGFHLLGLTLFRSQLSAFLLALLSFGTVSLTIDYYGVYIEPQPRLLFLALLPYALLLLVRSAGHQRQWPGVFAVFGLLMYVHPVSAPTVAFASWLAAWTLPAPGMLFWRRFKWMVLAGFSFLLVATPFMLVYLSARAYGTVDDFDLLSSMNVKIYGLEYSDYRAYIATVLTRWETRLLLPIWGAAGLLAVWFLSPGARRLCLFLIVWSIAILAGSVGITAAEQALSQATRTMPVEIDLIRNVRYICLPLVTFGVWGTCLTMQRIRPGYVGMAAAALICLAWLGLNRPGSIPFRESIACLKQGAILCQPPQWAKSIAALDVLRALPPGTPVLPVTKSYHRDFLLAIRYYALQPLVFAHQDGGSVLGYADFDQLQRWWDLRTEIIKSRAINDPGLRSGAILNIAQRLRAQAIVSDRPLEAKYLPKDWKIAFRNDGYTIAVHCSANRSPCAE